MKRVTYRRADLKVTKFDKLLSNGRPRQVLQKVFKRLASFPSSGFCTRTVVF